MATVSPRPAHRQEPRRVYWGPGALDHLAPELARAGVTRPLVVTGRSVATHPSLLTQLTDALGVPIAGLFTGVRPHTPLPVAVELSSAMDDDAADGLVVVGGGSAMVTARAAAVLHGERRPFAELATQVSPSGRLVSPRLTAAKTPIFVVPTTPTTAVAKAGTAVTIPGGNGRWALMDPRTRARTILVHPVFLGSSPVELVRDAVRNGLVMAVEGLATGRSTVFSDAVLVHAVRQLASLLPLLGEQDEDHRVDSALAAILVGDGTDTTGGGLTAALSHTLGHHHRAHNGAFDAVLLPHVLSAHRPAAPDLAHIAAGLGCGPSEVVGALVALLSDDGEPTRLRDLGVALDNLPSLAEEATGDAAYRRTAQPGVAALTDLLSAAW